jgi:uncharacterized protein YjbJ (UPF0337 family)
VAAGHDCPLTGPTSPAKPSTKENTVREEVTGNHAAKDGLENAVGHAKEFAGGAAENVKVLAGGTAEHVKEFAGQAAGTVKELAGGVTETAKGFWARLAGLLKGGK